MEREPVRLSRSLQEARDFRSPLNCQSHRVSEIPHIFGSFCSGVKLSGPGTPESVGNSGRSGCRVVLFKIFVSLITYNDINTPLLYSGQSLLSFALVISLL